MDRATALTSSTRLYGLLSYADLHESSPSGASQPGAFQSAVAPPKGPGGNTYYDDNGWSALDLIDAYRLTGNSTYLTLAQDLFNFAVTGWDTSQTDGLFGRRVLGGCVRQPAQHDGQRRERRGRLAALPADQGFH